ncbi:HK97 gp10 family phage protein [Streptosporangium amethystogenes]|uniref:HK97 gp10 family phage protein n=1 Tax=Streptosporangium amethystogenes TaxID=2002 RepID=UPI0004BDD2A8|nr:HK97 gp10 family phage protein [Streptosporangium amethystogenes]
MARLRLDRAALNRTFSATSRREGDAAARQVVARAKVLAPVDTGRLRASIRVERRSFFGLRQRWTIGSDVEYAPMVNDGTRPHLIRPRRAQVLRFKVGGKTVFAKVVHHPGTRARPFLDRALRDVARNRGYDITQR